MKKMDLLSKLRILMYQNSVMIINKVILLIFKCELIQVNYYLVFFYFYKGTIAFSAPEILNNAIYTFIIFFF